MNIENGKVVSIHYTLTDDTAKVLDTSDGGEPLVYLHGKGNIIPGLEKALNGKVKGDKFTVTLQPEDAYGPRDDNMKQSIPRSQFPKEEKIEVGMSFQADTPQGPMVLHILTVNDQEVTVDANHPLAGVPLTFVVEVDSVRDASAEEMKHGHAHGPGGHHH